MAGLPARWRFASASVTAQVTHRSAIPRVHPVRWPYRFRDRVPARLLLDVVGQRKADVARQDGTIVRRARHQLPGCVNNGGAPTGVREGEPPRALAALVGHPGGCRRNVCGCDPARIRSVRHLVGTVVAASAGLTLWGCGSDQSTGGGDRRVAVLDRAAAADSSFGCATASAAASPTTRGHIASADTGRRRQINAAPASS